MFSGIVEDVGTVVRAQPRAETTRLVLRTLLAPSLRVGESLAVDGVCLTVTGAGKRDVSVTAVPETLRKTTLGRLRPGARVNLEAAMRLGDRIGGHLVQGHVEGVGRVRRITPRGDSTEMEIDAGRLARYLVHTGSVAVDGISLTVAGLERCGFRVALIPHTLAATTLGQRRVGDPVNLETDILAKYVERLLGAGAMGAPRGRHGSAAKDKRWA